MAAAPVEYNLCALYRAAHDQLGGAVYDPRAWVLCSGTATVAWRKAALGRWGRADGRRGNRFWGVGGADQGDRLAYRPVRFSDRVADFPLPRFSSLGTALLVWAHLGWAGLPVAGAVLWYLALYPDQLIAGYAIRDFTLTERVLTEPRILWHYLKWMLVPDIRALGLFHDDLPISHSLFDPPLTFAALWWWGVVIAAAVWYRRQVPVLAFGVLFFLAGQALESTVFPLEIVHEHRNYLPSWGIDLALGYSLLHPGSGLWARPALQFTRSVALIGFVLLAAGNTWARALSWSDERALVVAEVTHHPQSARANFTAARVMIEAAERIGRTTLQAQELRQLARIFYQHANRLDDYHLLGYFGLMTLDALDGRSVDRERLEELKFKLRTGPVAANRIYTLTQLLKDDLNDRWGLSSAVLLEATEALLANPRLAPSWRKEILIHALQVAFRRQLYPQALRFAQAQVALDPEDAAFRLNLAQALFFTGDVAGAAAALEEAARLDSQGRLAEARAYIERKIARKLYRQRRSG